MCCKQRDQIQTDECCQPAPEQIPANRIGNRMGISDACKHYTSIAGSFKPTSANGRDSVAELTEFPHLVIAYERFDDNKISNR